jgi:hypothetical protein
MNIILGQAAAEQSQEKYIVLELDTLKFVKTGQTLPAFCIIDRLNIDDIVHLEQWRELHTNLIKNYRSKNWEFCEQAIEHLTGHWQGELDSFYKDVGNRVQQLKTQDLEENWDWAVIKH